jgi:hypothetical protein
MVFELLESVNLQINVQRSFGKRRDSLGVQFNEKRGPYTIIKNELQFFKLPANDVRAP